MQIVLPGALPDPAIAPELASHLEKKAPRFTEWLSRAQAHVMPAAPGETFCTTYEYWLLHYHGFTPDAQQRPAAGLSAILAHEAGAPVAARDPLADQVGDLQVTGYRAGLQGLEHGRGVKPWVVWSSGL